MDSAKGSILASYVDLQYVEEGRAPLPLTAYNLPSGATKVPPDAPRFPRCSSALFVSASAGVQRRLRCSGSTKLRSDRRQATSDPLPPLSEERRQLQHHARHAELTPLVCGVRCAAG